MKSAAILVTVAVMILTAIGGAAEKSEKKINFAGAWILQNVKNSASGGAQPGGAGGGMRRGGGYPRGGYPGGGRTGGGGRQGGGRQTGSAGDGGGMVAPPSYSLLIVEQSDTALKLTYRSGDTAGQNEFAESFMLDGSESANSGFGGSGTVRSRSSWNKDKLVTLGTQETSPSARAASDVVFKQEISISKNGKTLTVKTTRTLNGRSSTREDTYARQAQSSS